jgi:hypothetical protein
MTPPTFPTSRAQRQQAIQARMLKNRNLLGQPQAPSEHRNIL